MTFGPVTINRPGASATVGIMGPKGKKGAPGKDGAPGPQGPAVFLPIVAWVSGTTYSPGTATQAASYVSIGGSSYACTAVHTAGVFAADLAAGLWQLVGGKGDKGDAGTPGSTWYTGTAAPANAVGINGDYFFRSDTADVLLKVSAAWTTIGNLKGLAGNTVNTGLGPPAAAVGVNGDSYIDVTPGAPVFWGPKAGGAWPASGTSLVGPSGPGNGSVNPSGATTQGNIVVFGANGTVILDSGVAPASLATTTQLAALPSNANPTMAGTAAPGGAATLSRSDHTHPSDTTRLAVAAALAEIAGQGSVYQQAALGNLGALTPGQALALAIVN